MAMFRQPESSTSDQTRECISCGRMISGLPYSEDYFWRSDGVSGLFSLCSECAPHPFSASSSDPPLARKRDAVA